MKRFVDTAQRVLYIMTLFFSMTATVFAQSDVFEKLTTVEIGREVPSWVTQQGIPVPNTDLRDPGKLIFSFPSDDPASSHTITVRNGVVVAIQLFIPEEKRRFWQNLLFAGRYDRVLVAQDSRETAYYLPLRNMTVVVDSVTGDVVRIEKASSHATQKESAPVTSPLVKRIAYIIIGLSLAAIALLLLALAIEVSQWKPKEGDELNPAQLT